VQKGDEIPGIEVPGGRELPALVIDPGRLMLGDAADGQGSWTSRVLRLRDRDDLGPFRLAFLEALVRMGDWRASRSYRLEVQ
jgi:CRISPR-associated endonuclease/helicase Cas3